jgi:hypothetical protein
MTKLGDLSAAAARSGGFTAKIERAVKQMMSEDRFM